MTDDRATPAKIKKARLMAMAAHANQLYDDQPYAVHLQAVVDVLLRFGFEANAPEETNLFVTAWLHDVVEDTPISLAYINHEFGPEVASIVWRLTDGAGASRAERKRATYSKLKGDESALVVKLADRIANVEASAKMPHFLKTYRKEHPAFKEAVSSALHDPRAWAMVNYLDSLMSMEP